MDNRKLGIGSFAYRYEAGIPGFMPVTPMTPQEFIEVAATKLGLKRIQLCENIKYADQDEKTMAAMVKRTRELDLAVELGMYGATEENLRKHIRLAQLFQALWLILTATATNCFRPT